VNRGDEGLRVLVVGAGVGGISIARALLRDGHDVTVFERRPDVAAGGGAVTIWPNGATVLGQLGVDLEGAGQLLSTLRIATPSGRALATIDLAAIADRLGGPVRMIPRRALLERLLTGFPTGRIRRNSHAVEVSGTAGGVRIAFADGTAVEGDLLIGADGLHSTVRELLGAQPAKPTGWCSWQGLLTLPDIADVHVAQQVVGEHGSVGLWPAGGTDLQWWFDLRWSSDVVRPNRPIDMIRSNFTGWSDDIDRVLAALTDDDLAQSPYPHFRHPVPRLPRDLAVTMLGDAVHTMPPFLAQGTNQALLDTMILRKVLSDLPSRTGGDLDLPSALRRYENTRRRQVKAVSWVASRQVSQKEFVLRPAAIIPDRLATWVLTGFLRAVSHHSTALSLNQGLHQAQR
jgi:FAD-dependent urate hydroxylase